MAYQIDQDTRDITIAGFEQGIQPSPHKGIANIQGANISTETGEVMASFNRVLDTMTNSTATGTLSYVSTDHVSLSIANTNNLFKGQWIVVTNSSNTSQLPNGTYYVPLSTGANFELSNYYNDGITQPAVTVQAIVVGGGGAGGGAVESTGTATAGGGGGGGQVVNSTASITQQTYTITVGAGGVGSTVNAAGIGSTSSFATLNAVGGGGGGGRASGGTGTFLPSSGASGGGGGAAVSNTTQTGGTATAGNAGGSGLNSGSISQSGAGGGGGATVAGSNGVAPTATGGNGGAGATPTINGVNFGTLGSGGGGGGGNTAGTGGSNAGNGVTGNSAGGNAGANSGSGGGGASGGAGGTSTYFAGGNGGAGTVVISAIVGAFVDVTYTNATHSQSGGYDFWVFSASGTWAPTLFTTSNPANLTGFTAGLTATIQLQVNVGKPIAKATETYYRSGVAYNRYYVLDNQNLVWVYDTYNETLYASTDNVNWFLPDYQTSWDTGATGIAVFDGWLFASAQGVLYAKSVALLGNTSSQSTTWTAITDMPGWQGGSLTNPHFLYVASTSLYATDSNYILKIFPDSTLAAANGNSGATLDNVQTFCSFTATSATIGTYSVISGTSPATSDGKLLPVIFFANNGSTLPGSITAGQIYYISASINSKTFLVYSTSSGGSPINLVDGAAGTTFYFNTFYPIVINSNGTNYTLTQQRFTLPPYEIAQCMAQIGITIVIGCAGNLMYPWNQVDNSSSGIIALPEANVSSILTVHQMGYVFVGNKGNIYLTDGNLASAVTTVPDYCAGVPGNQQSYIDPVFSWGDSMYLRGRVYFSILDQTTSKAGNCGGVWSFVPTQNLYIGQDVGIAMHLENQSSYGTYNGVASVLIPKMNQKVKAPQYFSGWSSSVSSPIYGIDATGTTPGNQAIIETDAIPVGTMLGKETSAEIEYKVATALQTGESVAINFRNDLTGTWTSCGVVNTEVSALSGYYTANFEKAQWLQLQIVLNPTTTGSFTRLTEIRTR
jgi:hypothetical protein